MSIADRKKSVSELVILQHRLFQTFDKSTINNYKFLLKKNNFFNVKCTCLNKNNAE